MHAVVVRVTINDRESAQSQLRDQVVPTVRQAPGFQTGYWMANGDNGISFIVFDSEEAARSASEMVRSAAPGGVTVEEVDVREVVAHA